MLFPQGSIASDDSGASEGSKVQRRKRKSLPKNISQHAGLGSRSKPLDLIMWKCISKGEEEFTPSNPLVVLLLLLSHDKSLLDAQGKRDEGSQ